MRRESWDRLDLFLEEQSEVCSSFEIPGVVIDVFKLISHELSPCHDRAHFGSVEERDCRGNEVM